MTDRIQFLKKLMNDCDCRCEGSGEPCWACSCSEEEIKKIMEEEDK